MTSPAFLLDTNILSAFVRDPRGPATQRLRQVGETSACTSVVVACELRFGAAKSQNARVTQRVNDILDRLPVLPLEPAAAIDYAEIRARLESSGTVIGPNDLLIAAHARSLGMILATGNSDEFRRVPGLGVENWLA